VDDEGRRTGHRDTKLIGAGGKEVSKEEMDAHKASVEKMHSPNVSIDTDTTGGVKLSPTTQLSPGKTFQEGVDTQIADDSTKIKSAAKVEGDTVMENPSEDTPMTLEPEIKPTKIAVVLKFTLGTSQYATMALRELMGAAGVKTYKPDFSGGR